MARQVGNMNEAAVDSLRRRLGRRQKAVEAGVAQICPGRVRMRAGIPAFRKSVHHRPHRHRSEFGGSAAVEDRLVSRLIANVVGDLEVCDIERARSTRISNSPGQSPTLMTMQGLTSRSKVSAIPAIFAKETGSSRETTGVSAESCHLAQRRSPRRDSHRAPIGHEACHKGRPDHRLSLLPYPQRSEKVEKGILKGNWPGRFLQKPEAEKQHRRRRAMSPTRTGTSA